MGVNSLPWYYIPTLDQAVNTISLEGEEWHHCFHVLRMSAGESIILFDGQGHCMEGIIRSASKNEGEIELVSDRSKEFQIDRDYRLSVAFAPTKNMDRTEFAVEKLVELGVDEIGFLECQYGERTHLRMDRINKIAISAAKQSRKVILPDFVGLVSPMLFCQKSKIQCFDYFDSAQHKSAQHKNLHSKIFCCHLDSDSGPIAENYSPGFDVLMLIGPEGGFSNEEIQQLKNLGAITVTLGPSRLRVETAAIAACNTIHVLNDLKKTI